MKKSLLSLLLIGVLLLSGCGARREETKPYTVIATVFPLYDWAREIIGENEDISLTCLTESGVDLHSYQVTAADMAAISDCDLFLYIGGESDEWVEEVLEAVPNPKRVALNMMEVLEDQLHQEETVEGMQLKPSFGGEEEEEYDEHIWLSLRNASLACQAIGEALSDMDDGRADGYLANCAAYREKLNALDEAFAAAPKARDTLIFCDRFPFRYLIEDYGLRYYAAFSGCSGDSEASFATVLFLAEKADALEIPVLLQLESADGQLAATVGGCMEKKPAVLTLDSMQAVALRETDKTYLQTMENNLLVLRQALER